MTTCRTTIYFSILLTWLGLAYVLYLRYGHNGWSLGTPKYRNVFSNEHGTSKIAEDDMRNETCKTLCTVRYDPAKGYPLVADSGLYGDYICPSMFRDLSEYVFEWPYSHFNEVASAPDLDKVLHCLPPIPIMYSKGDPWFVQNFIKKIGDRLKPGFILLTGQTAYPSPGENKKLLDNPKILKWYASHPDIIHPKFQSFPVGLDCYEHGEGMLKFHNKYGNNIKEKLQNNRKRMENGDLKKLAVINFGDTHPIRKTVKTQLCTEQYPFIECLNKLWKNNITGNEKLSFLYERLSNYPFWISPRGAGIDTHRTWEALYVGSIPIVQKSILDPLFKDLPVLLIDNYKNLTEKLLKETLIKFSEMDIDTKTLHRNYWWSNIETSRSELLKKLNVADTVRYRCWGT